MKTLLAALLLFSPALAVPVTLTANFNQAVGPLGTSYEEGGLQFSSPTQILLRSGATASAMFGNQPVDGNIIRVQNTGWLGIAAGGSDLQSLSFRYGFDWGSMAIGMGMQTILEWQAMQDGQLVADGSFGATSQLGGYTVSFDGGGNLFDELLVRSISTWEVGSNRIALDDVMATMAEQPEQSFRIAPVATPDGGMTGLMFGTLILTIAALRTRGKYL
jgi:hypothetical protein